MSLGLPRELIFRRLRALGRQPIDAEVPLDAAPGREVRRRLAPDSVDELADGSDLDINTSVTR